MMNAECRILTSTFCILHSIKDVRLPPGAVRRRREPEVSVRIRRRTATARRARQETLLHQERLVHLLERSWIFTDGGGDRREPHRASVELLDDRLQDAGIMSSSPNSSTSSRLRASAATAAVIVPPARTWA